MSKKNPKRKLNLKGNLKYVRKYMCQAVFWDR